MRRLEMNDRETCNKNGCDESACIVLKVYTSDGPRYVALCRDHGIAVGPKMLGMMLRKFDKEDVAEDAWAQAAVDQADRAGGQAVSLEEIRADRSASDATATLTPAEAVFGVLAWLTTRDEVTTLGAACDSAPAAAIAAEFCKTNNLGSCRDEWATYLTHPKE